MEGADQEGGKEIGLGVRDWGREEQVPGAECQGKSREQGMGSGK